jgi:hypothetical protein
VGEQATRRHYSRRSPRPSHEYLWPYGPAGQARERPPAAAAVARRLAMLRG